MSLRSRLRPFRRGAAYALVMGLLVFARVLPRGLGLSLFALAGGLAFLFHADARRTSLANMALAFGEKYSGRKRWLMALETFMNLGRNVFDALRLPFMSDETLLGMATVENEETLKQVLSQGKGVVVPTGHIGNWELFAAHMSERGYPVSVVAKTLKDPRLNNLLLKVRKSRGVESIDKEAGVQKILRALRKGRVLGILMDQDTKAKGIYVEFLGRKAFTPTAPAELAVKTGVPLIPITIVMNNYSTYRVKVGDPLEVPDGLDSQQKIERLTRLCNRYLEQEILDQPTQWIWMHKRWKSAPP